MGVALTRRGDRIIGESIRAQFAEHFRLADERDLWKRADAKEREARVALANLWRYEAGPLKRLLPGQRLTVRESALWLELRATRARLNKVGANAHQWGSVHRRVHGWATRVLRRWVRLCSRRVGADPRLVEIEGIQVCPFGEIP